MPSAGTRTTHLRSRSWRFLFASTGTTGEHPPPRSWEPVAMPISEGSRYKRAITGKGWSPRFRPGQKDRPFHREKFPLAKYFFACCFFSESGPSAYQSGRFPEASNELWSKIMMQPWVRIEQLAETFIMAARAYENRCRLPASPIINPHRAAEVPIETRATKFRLTRKPGVWLSASEYATRPSERLRETLYQFLPISLLAQDIREFLR
jgi:hypothetical protein